MKPIILTVLFIFSILNLYSQIWGKPLSAGSTTYSVCFDNKNNQYATGEFDRWGKMFASQKIDELTTKESGMFFGKLDSSQNLKWLKIIIPDWGIYKTKVKIAKNQDVVMVGNYIEGITIDSVSRHDGDRDFRNFIARFSPEGKLKFVSFFGKTIVEDFYIDSQDQVYVTGHYQGTVKFDEKTEITNQTITGYFAKFDAGGKFINAFSIGSDWQIESYAIIVDLDENVYIGGFIAGNGDFGTNKISSYQTDQFIAKFDATNKNIWVKHFGATRNDCMESIYSLCLDHTGKYFYAAGVIQGRDISFDDQILPVEDKNIFLGKFALDGSVRWVESFGNWSGSASYTEEAGCVSVAPNTGFVYLNGTFMRTADFNGITIKGNGNSGGSTDIDLFLAKLNPEGNVEWVKQCGGLVEDRIMGLTTDLHGNPCLTGRVTSLAHFDDFTLTEEYQAAGCIATVKDTATYYFKLHNDTIFLNPYQKYVDLEITTNTVWSTSSVPEWMIEQGSHLSGSNNWYLSLDVLTNNLAADRKGKLTFKSFGLGDFELVVVQKAGTTSVNPSVKPLTQGSVYPTITNQFVYFENFGGNESISIYSSEGNFIYREPLHQNRILDISDLKSGIYLLSVEYKGVRRVFKIVKN